MGFYNRFDFQKDLNEFALMEVPKEYKRRQIEIIIFLYVELQDRTPIAEDDSDYPGFKGGHAMSNWRVSMNFPRNGVLGRRGAPSRPIPVESIRVALDTMKAGQFLWVYNNVHYLQALADGHSQQAPAGYMIEGAIEKVRLLISTASANNWGRGWTKGKFLNGT